MTAERAPEVHGLRVGTDEMLTSKQAALLLGVSSERIMQFIRDGRLAARKEQRDWFISKKSIEGLAATPRPPGRPKGKREVQ